ncbi:MAG TPA: hypothetical protein VLA51_04675, partial [Paracoccaceae bacterium]|nr:hypothetical protein [Paracoccaceae bacterium]
AELPTRVGFLDLMNAEPEILLDASDEDLFAAVDASPKLIKSIAINKDPSLFTLPDPDPDIVRKAGIIAARPDFQERVGWALASRFADREAPADVEEQIYSGFFDRETKAALGRFQSESWEARLQVVSALGDARLKTLGMRLVMLEAPELFAPERIQQVSHAILARWSDSEGKWNNFARVESDLEMASSSALLGPQEIIELRKFFDDRKLALEAGHLHVEQVAGSAL